MHSGKTVLAQILEGLHPEEFRRCAERHPMRRVARALSAYEHFVALVFAQLTYRESLRDIEVCLGSRRKLLYHSGIRGVVRRCNLAYANEKRSAALFAEVAMCLMRRARRIYQGAPPELGLDGELFAVDSTLIHLSIALFPWARWQGTQAAVKLNVMLSVHTELPAFCSLAPGKKHDVHFMDQFPVTAGSYYVFDRGYLDFSRLRSLAQKGAWFVIRAKCNLRFYVSQSRKIDKGTGLRSDQTIRFNSSRGKRDYPEKVRRVRYFDEETGRSLVFLTNNFDLPALTIAQIYRRRWEIELFFRWIKQHLRLRGFFSTTPNGVAVQVWTAISAYLLVAIAKREQALQGSLHQVLQIISVSAFEKVPLPQLFTKDDTRGITTENPIQLEINDL